MPKNVKDQPQIKAGDRVDFVITDGDVVLPSASGDIRELRGMLSSRRRSVTVEQMNAAVLRQHARNR